MAEEETVKTELEAQPEAKPPEVEEQPQAQETAPEAPKDDLSPKQGESLEAYANRIRNEVSWRDRQLTQQHKRIKDRDAKAIEIEQELQRVREQKPPEQPKPAIPPQNQRPNIAPDALAAARYQIELERTQAQLDKNPEWPAALANLQRVGSIPEQMMREILATDDPAYVVVALGKDMNKFTSIAEMNEDKRRAALIKIGMEPEQKATIPTKTEPKIKPSDAPPPTRALPSGGSAVAPEGDIDLYDPKYANSDYDDAWYKKRLEQKMAAKNRPWSFGGRGGAAR